MHSNLACHEVLSTRDHVRASFYSEGSGPFSPVNESKKKLKCRLGSWGRPLKKVTLPSRPEGWLWSHCFSVIGKNQKRAKDLSTPKWHITQGMPFHQQPVEAAQWDGGGVGEGWHIHSQRGAVGPLLVYAWEIQVHFLLSSYCEVLCNTPFTRMSHAPQHKN